MFFSQKAATLKTPKNQTNYKQLQKQKPRLLVRSLYSSRNPQKTIKAGDHKNGKPKGGKNKKSILLQYGKTPYWMGNVQKIERKL